MPEILFDKDFRLEKLVGIVDAWFLGLRIEGGERRNGIGPLSADANHH